MSPHESKCSKELTSSHPEHHKQATNYKSALPYYYTTHMASSSQLFDQGQILWSFHGEVASLSSWHHVWTKFAIPILHAIYNFKIYDIFPTYT